MVDKEIYLNLCSYSNETKFEFFAINGSVNDNISWQVNWIKIDQSFKATFIKTRDVFVTVFYFFLVSFGEMAKCFTSDMQAFA